MKITPLQQDIIKSILRNKGVVIGYIFGSYARGTAGPLSDIDIGIVFPDSITVSSQEDNIEDIRNDLEKIFGKDKVDIVNVTKIKNPLLQYLIVLGEGILLYADDIPLKNNISRYFLKNFEDTKYLRNIQAKTIRKIFA